MRRCVAARVCRCVHSYSANSIYNYHAGRLLKNQDFAKVAHVLYVKRFSTTSRLFNNIIDD
jgi:hypothetical protein